MPGMKKVAKRARKAREDFLIQQEKDKSTDRMMTDAAAKISKRRSKAGKRTYK